MNKEIQPKVHKVEFKCASCGAVFHIDSTYNNDVCHLDICSKCHPFYIGKNNQATVKTKSDRLNSKFTAGKQFNETSKKTAVKKAINRKKDVKLDSLKDVKVAE